MVARMKQQQTEIIREFERKMGHQTARSMSRALTDREARGPCGDHEAEPMPARLARQSTDQLGAGPSRG
jgi:hypothetical protein